MKRDIIISLILFGVSASCVDLWVELSKFKNIISLPNFIVFFSFFRPPKAAKPFLIIYDYIYYFSDLSTHLSHLPFFIFFLYIPLPSPQLAEWESERFFERVRDHECEGDMGGDQWVHAHYLDECSRYLTIEEKLLRDCVGRRKMGV